MSKTGTISWYRSWNMRIKEKIPPVTRGIRRFIRRRFATGVIMLLPDFAAFR